MALCQIQHWPLPTLPHAVHSLPFPALSSSHPLPSPPLTPSPSLFFSLSPGFQVQIRPTLTLSAYQTAAASEDPSHPAPHTLPAAFGSSSVLAGTSKCYVIKNMVTADRPKVRYSLQSQALPRTSCVTCVSHCLSLRLSVLCKMSITNVRILHHEKERTGELWKQYAK